MARTLKDIMNTNYAGLSKKSNYIEILQEDAKKLQQITNQKISKVRIWERKFGVSSPALDVIKSKKYITKNGNFSLKGIMNDEKALKEKIDQMRNFNAYKTSSYSGFRDVLFNSKKQQLGEMFGKSSKWGQREISDENIKNYWRTYNKIKELAKIEPNIYKYLVSDSVKYGDEEKYVSDIEQFIWDESLGKSKKERNAIDWDGVFNRVLSKVRDEIGEIEDEYNTTTTKAYKQTGRNI